MNLLTKARPWWTGPQSDHNSRLSGIYFQVTVCAHRHLHNIPFLTCFCSPTADLSRNPQPTHPADQPFLLTFLFTQASYVKKSRAKAPGLCHILPVLLLAKQKELPCPSQGMKEGSPKQECMCASFCHEALIEAVVKQKRTTKHPW